MNKYIYFEYAGIKFKVEVDINCSGEFEGIFGVEVWNRLKNAYEPLYCDLEKFEEALKDSIFEAIEEKKLNDRLAAEDLAYDVMMGK